MRGWTGSLLVQRTVLRAHHQVCPNCLESIIGLGLVPVLATYLEESVPYVCLCIGLHPLRGMLGDLSNACHIPLSRYHSVVVATAYVQVFVILDAECGIG